MDMTSNLKLIDDCARTLKRIIPIVDDSEEAKILDQTMRELTSDIEYIQKKLEVAGLGIEKLQTEVYHVNIHHLAELTKYQRSNLKTVCKAGILQ